METRTFGPRGGVLREALSWEREYDPDSRGCQKCTSEAINIKGGKEHNRVAEAMGAPGCAAMVTILAERTFV